MTLLDYLDQKRVKATFFLVGSQVLQLPAVVKAIFDRGHQIGVHTWSHRGLNTLSNEQIISELEWSIKAVEEVIKTRPRYYRPPYGALDDRVRAISKAMGVNIVSWKFNTTDWLLNNPETAFTPDNLRNRIRQEVAGADRGIVDLSHDLTPETVQMAPTTVEEVLNLGLKPMSVAECIGDLSPYSNPSIKVGLSNPVTTVGSVSPITGSGASRLGIPLLSIAFLVLFAVKVL
jgi:peptidoglycan/xylan/chitin deacetylase (PgdA/CDA1 family)